MSGKRLHIFAVWMSVMMIAVMIMSGCAGTGGSKEKKTEETTVSEAAPESVQEETAGPETQAETIITETETVKTETSVIEEAETVVTDVEAVQESGEEQDAFVNMFADYYDYQNDDGTFSYYFPECGMTVTMNEEWYHSVRLIIDEYGATFYQKAGLDAFIMNEGYEGGRLFTLGASVNSDFSELPSFRYIGFNENDMMNYFAVFPTDYQAYVEDEEIRAEYDELWSEVEEIVDSIQLDGSTE